MTKIITNASKLFFKSMFLLLIALFSAQSAMAALKVRIKDITHFSGLIDNPVVGYGLVVGLAGTGDSNRAKQTVQSVANMLKAFNVNVPVDDLNTRNVAAVMLTASLSPYAYEGDKIDVQVSSLGDARSLVGGTLLIAPMKAADNQTYVIAQGAVSVGGYKYDMFGNVVQKNHPTVGLVSNGGIVEKTLDNHLLGIKDGTLQLVLNRADFTTASRIADKINSNFGIEIAKARSPAVISLIAPTGNNLIDFISIIERLNITPDDQPVVVVNERTGTIVTGGDVVLDSVSISQGDLQINIQTDYSASQPWLVRQTGDDVKTVVLPHTKIHASEDDASLVSLQSGATIADLISALAKVKASTRDVISVLEALKRSGALHAELIVQ
ncbi:flagellar basal body P-ring protein FlgI [Cysteiniphilum litorale]|uniref:flagellar basal body P-ring protein FlgI n=1 Tax=Cysteiniphilum litorale TaxID=2056700 RepID=UPI003F88061E